MPKSIALMSETATCLDAKPDSMLAASAIHTV